TTEHEGEVSTILHDEFQEGDNINLTAPVGPFHVVEKGKRQLFLGSGIGVTPLVSMFNEVVNDNGEARFIQVTNDMDDAPFSSLLTAIANENTQATYDLYDKNKNGYIGSEQLKQWIDNDTEIYV
ncbi:nitric oxide dioxygenase, partial [Vibrio vulnificus]